MLQLHQDSGQHLEDLDSQLEYGSDDFNELRTRRLRPNPVLDSNELKLGKLLMGWSMRATSIRTRWPGSVLSEVIRRQAALDYLANTRLLHHINMRHRARYRFVNSHATKSQLVFFASPPYRTLGKPKDPLDHPKHIFAVGANLRLGSVAGALRLLSGKNPGIRGLLTNHGALSALRRRRASRVRLIGAKPPCLSAPVRRSYTYSCSRWASAAAGSLRLC